MLDMLRHRQLQLEIAMGIEQLDRGFGIECDGEASLRAFFDEVVDEARRELGHETSGDS